MVVKKKIAIIGGGAAGMMTAATLIEEKANTEIHLFEKNDNLGVKVSISGGGRCNVTTGQKDKNLLLKAYTRGADFLKPAMSAFPPEKVFTWFETHGIPLKTEEDLRVFPQSDNGSDVIKLFEQLFKNKVVLHLQEAAETISFLGNKFKVQSKNGSYDFDFLVITSGGNAYSHTGSSGDGYSFAKDLGHSITKLGPSLNSFEVKENWIKELSGISFESAELKFNKIKCTAPLLLTHFGVSGPCAFALSSNLAYEEISEKHPLTINFTPISSTNYDYWNEKMLKDISQNKNKQIKNIISEYTPRRFCEALLKNNNINPDKIASELSKEERKTICHNLSGQIKITLIKRRKGDEFVTAGGVTTNEIDRKTMESKLIPNLYFAGEILDVDGLTGGYNLQAAWATGRLAGLNISKKLFT